MKLMKSIMALALVGFLSSPLVALAQDAAYITPSRAQEIREKEAVKRAEAEKRRAERRARAEAERKRAEAEYRDNVSDWYNRRDMGLSEDEMERNLKKLDGDKYQSDRRSRGGKYSQRLRRFSDDRDVIVLENVDRVFIVDDFSYDPWSHSYYGRDWDRGVNIAINVEPSWGWNGWGYSPWSWGRYDTWNYSWHYPWYDPWYRYTPSWYWHRPWHHHYGWGWTYSPWRSYDYGYWDGYHDARWYDRGYYYGSGRTAYNRSRRTYSSYGRSAGGYYDRTSQSSEYGRALGHGVQMRGNSTRAGGYYDRNGTVSRSYDGYSNRSGSTNSRLWDRGQSTTTRGSTWNRGGSSSTTRSSGSYSNPSRSSGGSSGGGSSSRSTGSSRRVR